MAEPSINALINFILFSVDRKVISLAATRVVPTAAIAIKGIKGRPPNASDAANVAAPIIVPVMAIIAIDFNLFLSNFLTLFFALSTNV